VGLFEFIAGLYVVIAGLGITLLVRSVGQMIESRDHVLFYWIHSSWIGFIFVLNVNSWFTLWSYRDLTRWTIGQFLLLVMVPTLLYLAAHVSVPEIPEDTTQRYDMRAYYFQRCRMLLGLIALSILANLSAEYLLVDHEMLTTENWIRLAGLAFLLTGLLSRRPWVHAGITLGALAIVAWSLGFVGHPLDQATR
jgi:hypothetical protein